MQSSAASPAPGYSAKVTWLGAAYGCRVFCDGKLVVEARCATRADIGPTLRDLLRTLDKCGGDAFTSAARRRMFLPRNKTLHVKHLWAPGEPEIR